MTICLRAEVDQQAKEKPNPVSTQKSAYVDEDDDNELEVCLYPPNSTEFEITQLHKDIRYLKCTTTTVLVGMTVYFVGSVIATFIFNE